MIYTVTFNPSLDYVIQTEELVPGRINRTTHECIYPGGKGNNVSVILSNLGLKSKALGFVAGFTGEALEKMCIRDRDGSRPDPGILLRQADAGGQADRVLKKRAIARTGRGI